MIPGQHVSKVNFSSADHSSSEHVCVTSADMLKTSPPSLAQRWVTPHFGSWEWILMIQTWFVPGTTCTAKVCHVQCAFFSMVSCFQLQCTIALCVYLVQVEQLGFPRGVNSGWPFWTSTAGREWTRSCLRCGEWEMISRLVCSSVASHRCVTWNKSLTLCGVVGHDSDPDLWFF